MKFSIPFLGTNIRQLPSPGVYDNDAVEAVIFNRKDLDPEPWKLLWENINTAISLYGPRNVTFHFPVNDSEYVKDAYIKDRLKEGLQRATDLGLQGMVVHSNQIELLPWVGVDLPYRRSEVINTLSTIRESVAGSTWLALENMPVMDNYGIEIDPLFVFPSDFADLRKTNVKVVWDVCHYTNSLSNMTQLFQGKQQQKYYPNIQSADYMDFMQINDLIAHWHFSAFLGIANPDTQEKCTEGIVPAKSELGESIYGKIMQAILKESPNGQHMVFEIKEDDYLNRIEMSEMLAWTKSLNSL